MYNCGCKCLRKNACSEGLTTWWPFNSFLTGILAAILFLFLLLFSLLYRVNYPRGAVAANGYECAEIGGKILEKGGSAVDATIATAFCETVTMPHACGIGGGFFMTVYTHKNGYTEVLNAREVAPIKSQKYMYTDKSQAAYGPLSVAVPGQVRGLAAAHKKYGMLDWKMLLEPSIQLCKNGIKVTEYLSEVLKIKEKIIMKNTGLRKLFMHPIHSGPYRKGEKITFPTLGKTLETIAKEGAEALYTGSLVKDFVKDIDGTIVEEDMAHYAPMWQEPVTSVLVNGENMYTSPLPGSGNVLSFILNILNGFIDRNACSLRTWQRIIEAMKHGYGVKTTLGDDHFAVKETLKNITTLNHAKYIRQKIFDDRTCQSPKYYGATDKGKLQGGTSNICILAPNGDAVVLSSTINSYFGAGFVSESTGIILNSNMDSFSRPCGINNYGAPICYANQIGPMKAPLSYMSPTIIIDWDRSKQLLIGAGGGPRIPSAIVLTILRVLWFNMTLEQAIGDLRIHHQLFPMKLYIEENFEERFKVLVAGFRQIGHEIETMKSITSSAVTAIYRDYDKIYAVTDSRGSGSVYYVAN